jgi:Flp pilus assembly protein TadD
MRLYHDGCYDDAVAEIGAELASAPDPDVCFAMGACIIRAGNLLAAVPHFKEAVRLRANFPEAHTMLGILYERHGLLYESIEEYKQGVKKAQEQVMVDGRTAPINLWESNPAYMYYKL